MFTVYMFIRYYVLFVARPFVLSIVSPAYRQAQRQLADHAETVEEAEWDHYSGVDGHEWCQDTGLCEWCHSHEEVSTYYEPGPFGEPREVQVCRECAEREGQ